MAATRGPARNRVSPQGDIIAVAGRGAWMGNRGRLHQGRDTHDIVRNHQNKTWITCVLSFKDRKLAQWQPNRYTLLFFLDEAVAMSAGHRPCAECRRSDYNRYRALWSQTHGGVPTSAKEMDDQLHRERTDPAEHRAPWGSLPDGVFVQTQAGSAVVVGDHLAVWDPQNNVYGVKLARPTRGNAVVITPQSTVDIIRAGYTVQVDETARCIR
jgi:hypothetical protein